MNNEAKLLQLDRMLYTKNRTPALLCYLAILINVFYFVNIYESDVGSWYYTLLVGSSIVYNLLFMLLVFLSSEAVKNYKKMYSVPLAIAGIGQLVRIFIIPLQAHNAVIKLSGVERAVMETPQFIRATAYLAVSAALLLLAAFINWSKCTSLENYKKASTAANLKETN